MRTPYFAAMALIAGTSAFHAVGASAQTYNAFDQYSIKNNPSGAWSYVSVGKLLTTKLRVCDAGVKHYCWTNGSTDPNIAAAEANKSGSTIHYDDVTLPARYLDFDPEQVADVSFQWTAPAAAKVHVTGNFLGVASDEGSHTVAVLHNASTLGSFTISHYQQKEAFKYTVTVAAGDTISFTSYTGNGGGALSTGLQAKIVTE